MGVAVEPASSAKMIRRERTGRLDLAEGGRFGLHVARSKGEHISMELSS